MGGERFADAACWIALLNKNDQHHELARRVLKDLICLDSRFVTTSAVVNETANSFDGDFEQAGFKALLRGG